MIFCISVVCKTNLTCLFQIDDLEQQVNQQRGQNSTHYEELLQARTKIDGYNSKLSELESANAHLKVKYIFPVGRHRKQFFNFMCAFLYFYFRRIALPSWKRAWIMSVVLTPRPWLPLGMRLSACVNRWLFSCRSIRI